MGDFFDQWRVNKYINKYFFPRISANMKNPSEAKSVKRSKKREAKLRVKISLYWLKASFRFFFFASVFLFYRKLENIIFIRISRQKKLFAGEKCSICDREANGIKYNAISCDSCRVFFRRIVLSMEKNNRSQLECIRVNLFFSNKR